MKASPLTLAAAAVLWIGTMIGAYQFGHRQHSAAGTSAAGRDGQRSAEQPLTVKQLFAKVEVLTRPDSMQNPMSMMRALALVDRLRPEDIPAALAEVEKMEIQQSKMVVLMAVVGKWAILDGGAAMKYAEDHTKDNEALRDILTSGVVSVWAEKDIDAVLAWYECRKYQKSSGMSGGKKVLKSIFSSLMNTDPEAAYKRLGELDREDRYSALAGMSQAAVYNDAKRQKFFEHIATMSDTYTRKTARESLLLQWCMFAPDKAASWVARQPVKDQDEMREGVCDTLLIADIRAWAIFMVQEAKSGEKSRLYSKVAATWGRVDPDAAAAWLEEQGRGPELDAARGVLARAAAKSKPVLAMAQALAITDTDQRIFTAAAVYHDWHATDAAAADKAIENLGLTAAQINMIKNPRHN